MIVVGLGFRAAAETASLRAACAAVLGGRRADALATVADKADAPALRALATEMGLPVIAVARADLAGQQVATQSDRVAQRFGTGSVAEAAALAASGGRLVGTRVVSEDGMATAALAAAKEGWNE